MQLAIRFLKLDYPGSVLNLIQCYEVGPFCAVLSAPTFITYCLAIQNEYRFRLAPLRCRLVGTDIKCRISQLAIAIALNKLQEEMSRVGPAQVVYDICHKYLDEFGQSFSLTKAADINEKINFPTELNKLFWFLFVTSPMFTESLTCLIF